MTIAAVLVVRDEETMLEPCLESLSFCDEIVVLVDDQTTDRTAAIAQRYTSHVLHGPFVDHAQTRNTATAHSTAEWVLHVDADERITPELAAAMTRAVSAPGENVAFRSETVNFFWGCRMNHGGWGGMMQVRLMRREYAVYRGAVHPSLSFPDGRVGLLDGELWHFSHRSIQEGLEKTIAYGRLEAADAFAAAAPAVTPWRFLRVMALEFGRRMIRRTGWRDGMPGIIEALFQPFVRFCAQVMLWELQQGDAVGRRYAALDAELVSRRAASRSPSTSKATGPGSSA
jgi:glycosyltransferase involved in cell wall biosynthesis